MPDVRRRDLGDAMGQAVAGIAGGLANGGSTAITQIRDMTSTGGGSGSSVTNYNLDNGGVLDSVELSSTDEYIETTLVNGLWIINASGSGLLTGGGSLSFSVRLHHGPPDDGYVIRSAPGSVAFSGYASASLVYVANSSGSYSVTPGGSWTTITYGLSFSAYRIA